MPKAKYKDFELTKGTPYLVRTGEPWGAYCGDLEEK